MIATHVFTINGRVWVELNDSYGPEADELARLLGRLNGNDRHSLILWKLLEGKSLDQVNPSNDARQYLQAAGSAERMTVEVRRETVDGAEQCVLGSPHEGSPGGESVVIPWGVHEVRVETYEVFDAAQASKIFECYYRTGAPPSSCSARNL